MALIGYVRCSTVGQHTINQIAALKEAGCTNISTEKVSGTVTDRKQLARAVAALTAGDVRPIADSPRSSHE